ncbi:MAG: hypothetical protein AAFQ43_01060 [Bacteroidota bacterium]
MPDSTRPLDEAVRDHYRAQSLSPDALAALREQIHDAAPAPAPEARRAADRPAASGARSARRWRAVAAVAAVLAIAASVTLVWPASGGVSTEAIASEIAMNHTRALDPDVQARSFSDLAADLEGLDFSVVQPDGMAIEKVVGARYCSLSGEMAAQIRFRDAKNRICTLYQAKDSDTFENVEEGTFDTGGVRVRVWREGGLVMGLAEPLEGA